MAVLRSKACCSTLLKLPHSFLVPLTLIAIVSLQRPSSFGGQIQHTAHVEQLRSLNSEWSKYGGLAICPETHAFFLRASRGKTSICEIGMGTGISALLFLLGSTSAKVHEFDIGDQVKHNVSKYLREYFNERFIPHWGDFYVEIPKTPLTCDLIYVDALHPDDVKLAMRYLGGESAEFIYHNGGGGILKARDYLVSEYRNNWKETEFSNTSRSDGARCVYYKGRLIRPNKSTAKSDSIRIG